LSGVDGVGFETSAALELELQQLRLAMATMASMSQLWAEMGLGLKQYHKGQAWVLNNTTKAKIGMGNTTMKYFTCVCMYAIHI
jgi:hypothetical protein